MIDPIFNMFKVRFEYLDTMKILKEDTEKVIVYINFEQVLKVLLNPKTNNALKGLNKHNEIKLQLMSNIVNLAMHYRLYFCKLGKDCRVVMYYNYPKGRYNNVSYIPNYKSVIYFKLFSDLNTGYIGRCMEEIQTFLTSLMAYMNEVYLIKSPCVESSLIPFILKEHVYTDDVQTTQHIIVSNSHYEYSYIDKGFTIISPNGKDSLYLTEDNVIDEMKRLAKIKSKDTIPTQFIPYTISLLGDKYRGITKMGGVGLGGIIKMINTSLDKCIITPNSTSVELLSDTIDEKYREQFINNYKCTSLDFQYSEVTDMQLEDILNQIVDKFDDNALVRINQKYFNRFPLMTINMKSSQVLDKSKLRHLRSMFG